MCIIELRVVAPEECASTKIDNKLKCEDVDFAVTVNGLYPVDIKLDSTSIDGVKILLFE